VDVGTIVGVAVGLAWMKLQAILATTGMIRINTRAIRRFCVKLSSLLLVQLVHFFEILNLTLDSENALARSVYQGNSDKPNSH